jgi:hypothetical protein
MVSKVLAMSDNSPKGWQVDAKSTFVWLRNALLLPMKPDSHFVIVFSMAAINCSSLSGSYAGATRMVWPMTDYASQEVNRLRLGIHSHCRSVTKQ